MGNTSTKWTSMTDKSIIESIGKYIKHQRLTQNKTQSQIAEHAGINRWTLSQIENGEVISLTSLIQILRALDILNVLDTFKVEPRVSPITLAKLEKQKRQRARNTDTNTKNESEW